MHFDLVAALPVMLPKAIHWAEQRASEISATGQMLSETEMAVARQVGVRAPERIRVSFVHELPLPDDPLLREAVKHTGFLGVNTIGLTLGHSIYIRKGHDSIRLLSHECRHVHQYEQAGSIAAFLAVYLQQIVHVGYSDAPYEIDARAHEIVGDVH